MERLYNWLLLKAIKGLGEVSIKKLWLNLGSVESILSVGYDDCKSLIGEEKTKAFFKKSLTFNPEEVVKLVEKEGINWLTLDEEKYPHILKEIEDPPPVLFYRGELKPIPMVGVVGTRKPDFQSLNVIRNIAKELVKRDYGLCSGGAVGCDFQGHKETLLAGGYTVCFLGMGIMRVPHYLQKLESEGMVLISELLPNATPDEFTFPRRNRLISGVSRCVVVVEAGEDSGALITARYAVKQKKPLWVFIGNSLSQRWLGCVKLVNQQKAKVLYSPSAMFEDLPSGGHYDDALLQLLSTPKTFDELLEIAGLSPSELTLKLSQLEIEGKITRNGFSYVAL
ncbi:MAG: DNA-protecting protein DprA [Aquificaceae bacterium]|nr:DNA-protecting protein DprA [Aquificaceae bacterium]